MRVYGLILLVWSSIFPAFPGLGQSIVSTSLPWKETSAVPGLTNIAGCLDDVRSENRRAQSLQFEATVTYFDQERGLVVLQDHSAAMAVYLPSYHASLTPGERILVQGSGVFPYVQTFPAYP